MFLISMDLTYSKTCLTFFVCDEILLGLGASMVLSNLEEDLKNNELEVTVFEKSDHLGGRVETFIYENKAIELGKDRISRSDKFMKAFIEKA